MFLSDGMNNISQEHARWRYLSVWDSKQTNGEALERDTEGSSDQLKLM